METNNLSAKKNRPVLVWVISIFYLISFPLTILSFGLFFIFRNIFPLTAGQEAYFNNLTTFDYGYTVLLMGINLAGAISLFLLRKTALYLFAGGLTIGTLYTIWRISTKGWLQAMGVGGPIEGNLIIQVASIIGALIGACIGYAISIAVCVYVWKLKKDKILT